MAENNFHRLDDDMFEDRRTEQIQRVKTDLDGSVSFIQMVGKIVEVYLPRVFDVFMLMSGGKENIDHNKEDSDKFHGPPSAGGFSSPGPNSGPSSPEA